MESAEAQPHEFDSTLFHEVFDGSPIGIAVEDLEGRPLFANPALCSMLGLSEAEMRAKHCSDFSPPEDAQKDWALFEQLRAGNIDHYDLEKRFYRRDGSVVWGHLSISLLVWRTRRFVIGIVEHLPEEKIRERQGAGGAESHENLTGLLVRVREEERRKIAGELHNIIEFLVLLSLNLDRARTESDAASREEVAKAKRRIESLVDEIQALSGRIYPSKLEILGLEKALASLCRECGERQNMRINFHAANVPAEVPLPLALCFYRIVEATLQYTTRSGPLEAQVELGCEKNALRLAVPLWDIQSTAAPTLLWHLHDLQIINDWLHTIGGDISIDASQPGAAILRVQAPLDADLS
jgi:PAS domain S-box-containing protein